MTPTMQPPRSPTSTSDRVPPVSDTLADPDLDFASTHDDAVTLSQLFDILRRHSPRANVISAQREFIAARMKGAKVLPNPILNFTALQLLSGYNQNGVGTYSLFVQQPLLVSGQRHQRKRAAREAEAAVESEIAAAFAMLAADARHLFVALQARQRHHATLDDAVADLERVHELVEGRYLAGAESRYDVARITLEVAEWKGKIHESTADLHDASGRLGVFVGRPNWRPRADGAFAPSVELAHPDALWADVVRHQPQLRAAHHRTTLAEREVVVAKREAWPQPILSFGIVGIDNYFSMSAIGGIAVPLPLFDYGQAPISRAEAEANLARHERDAVFAETRAELERALAVLQSRQRALTAFEHEVLAKTRDLRNLAEDAYITGQASILELIDASEVRYEIELRHVELVEAVLHAEIDLLHITGRSEEGA